MNPSAPPAQTPPAQAKAGPPLIRALACALALALASLSPCAPALAMGSLPWETPDQQQNASAPASNATAPEASASAVSSPAATPVAGQLAEPTAEPADAEGQAQFALLRQYFRRQLTLAEDFPEVFSRRVRDGEALAFQAMCAMQRRRGLLERFRSAEVDLSGLRFTRVTSDPDLARIRVTGRYSFTLGPKAPPADSPKAPTTAQAEANATAQATVHETLEEDALFVLLPELGEWKIYERREDWRP